VSESKHRDGKETYFNEIDCRGWSDDIEEEGEGDSELTACFLASLRSVYKRLFDRI
jgi:hypothetical protein